MEIKFKLKEVVEAGPALGKILNSVTDAKTSYWLGKTLNKLLSEIRDIEKARIKLVEKYGKKENDGSIKVIEDNIDDFKKEYEAFLEDEITIDMPKLKLEYLKDAKLSPVDMMALDKIIEETKEKL